MPNPRSFANNWYTMTTNPTASAANLNPGVANRSEAMNYYFLSSSAFNNHYGHGAFNAVYDVMKDPIAKAQWLSGQATLSMGIWVQSVHSVGTARWFGFSSSRNRLAGIEVINRFVKFNSASGRVGAQGGGGASWLSKAWNSDIARFYIPDVVYVNGSGVLTFLGGGGVDVGLALPLRGKSAGTVYLFSTLKGKAGLHGGVSVNIGRSNYLGPANLFDFTTTFGGKSSGLEGDYYFGASISASEYDLHGNSLLSIDIGVGPGIGGSVNIGAVTYTYPWFRIW